ncbi:hypothetical protein SLEP1_g15665 [Rubroshorea leprosula]|uniref:Uncharacterized protein n=1 Tax=Rubroshorea leprosula TaxID=152421 RepID=A0AAV5IN54_9ROSI|nr:hypothetical protein SLEP1_g15665 [Rubroshorea leprosula]
MYLQRKGKVNVVVVPSCGRAVSAVLRLRDIILRPMCRYRERLHFILGQGNLKWVPFWPITIGNVEDPGKAYTWPGSFFNYTLVVGSS